MDLLYNNIVDDRQNIVGDHSSHDIDQMIEDVDDDVFYAEVERSILSLINTVDENDDFVDFSNNYKHFQMRKGKFGQYPYFDWTENVGYSNYSVPSGILNLWRRSNVNGTGVFIPHTVKSKRKNKPRKWSIFFFTYIIFIDSLLALNVCYVKSISVCILGDYVYKLMFDYLL